jgi:dihydroflavonol-4-reductase
MSDQKTIFITGATGFVGAAVARLASQKGHKLRLLSRPNNDRRNLAGLTNYEIVEGDLNRPESYANALSGCDALFHVAADYRIWVPDPAAMHKTNVVSTESLMRAALAAKIERVVYTSSVATIRAFTDGTISNEETPTTHADMVGLYKGSKYLAEVAVKDMIAKESLPCVIVNPSTPIGPNDIKPTPTGRLIVEAAAGRMPAYVDTGLNVVHVDDVAMGHWLAYEKGRIGERYILGGTNLAFSDILKIVAKITGGKPPLFEIPRLPLYPFALVAELVARVTKKEPLLTLDGLRMAKKKMYFSSAKAEKELGYKARPAEEALADAVAWFRANGYC